MRCLIVAAHPDDEVIGASWVLPRFQEVHVAHVTDGAPTDRRLWPSTAPPTRSGYALLRQQEAADALALAGIPPKRIHELGFRDQDLCFQLSQLTHRLAALLEALAPDLLVTQPYEGGHPDHDAVAFAAQRALALWGPRAPARHLEMTSYHLGPHGWVTGHFLPWPSATAREVSLSVEQRRLKRKMFARFGTQSELLRLFSIDVERFRPAPAYDFALPPHPGPLLYEGNLSQVSGEGWRALALRAMGELGSASAPWA